MTRVVRTEFSYDDDSLLVQYLAKYCPTPAGRLGNKLYQQLYADEGNKWSWSKRHSWQSWRERYKKNQAEFDRKIINNQKKVAEKAAEKEAKEKEARAKANSVVNAAADDANHKKRKLSEVPQDSEKREKRVKLSEKVKEEKVHDVVKTSPHAGVTQTILKKESPPLQEKLQPQPKEQKPPTKASPKTSGALSNGKKELTPPPDQSQPPVDSDTPPNKTSRAPSQPPRIARPTNDEPVLPSENPQQGTTQEEQTPDPPDSKSDNDQDARLFTSDDYGRELFDPPSKAPPGEGEEYKMNNEGNGDQMGVHSGGEEGQDSGMELQADENVHLAAKEVNVASVYPDLSSLPAPPISSPSPEVNGFATSTPRPDHDELDAVPTPPTSAKSSKADVKDFRPNGLLEGPVVEKGATTDKALAIPQLKPKLKPNRGANSKLATDPFVSSSSDSDEPTRKPLPRPPAVKRPPVINDTGFRTTIGQERRWPPIRRHRVQSKPKANEDGPPESTGVVPDDQPKNSALVGSSISVDNQNSAPLQPTHLPPRQQPPLAHRGSGRVVDAEPSSSKMKLPPSHYRTREEVLSSVQIQQIDDPSLAHPTRLNTENERPPANTDLTLPRNDPSPVREPTRNPSPPQSISGSLRLRRHRAPLPSESKPASGVITGASTTLINDSGELNLGPVRLDDIFDKGKIPAARHDQVNYAIPPRIDLRESLALRRLKSRSSATSSSGRLSRSSSRASLTKRKQYPAVIPGQPAVNPSSRPHTAQYLEEIGRQVMSSLARRYGFSADVALKAFTNLGDLGKTEAFLEKLRARAQEVSMELLDSMVSDGEDEGAHTSAFDLGRIQLDQRRMSRPSVPRRSDASELLDLGTIAKERERHHRRSSLHRQVLDIRPIEHEHSSPEYDPPRSSRAGRYARRVKPLPGAEEMDAMEEDPSKFSSPQRLIDLRSPSLPRSSPRQRTTATTTTLSSPPAQQEDSPSPLQRIQEARQHSVRSSTAPSPPDGDTDVSVDGDADALADGDSDPSVNEEYNEYDGLFTAPQYEETDDDDAMDVEDSLLSSPDRTWNSDNPDEQQWQEWERIYDKLAGLATEENADQLRQFEQCFDPDAARTLTVMRINRLLDDMGDRYAHDDPQA